MESICLIDVISHFFIDHVGLLVNAQKEPKKRTMILLASSSLASAGAARMPGITCTVSLVIVE